VRSVALLVSGAALAAGRLVLTPAVRNQAGFEVALGFALTIALVVAMLLAAGLLWWRTPAPVPPAPVRRAQAAPASRGTGAKAAGKSAVQGASTAAKGKARSQPKGKRSTRR